MYANEMAMQQAIFELLPNLKFVPIIPPDDLVPPCSLMNLLPLQVDDDVADDDDEIANLGN
ncbi:hypothetical protein TIFTF001_034309 [Ficus carica]|uniref:Uncharacterized protein n=1 Tax=Ficus carica TaxID=3494 RepID=A0AA88DZN9_FICCA|nr:hypothetical protein TIFTF001_034309 [Ficus carica]